MTGRDDMMTEQSMIQPQQIALTGDEWDAVRTILDELEKNTRVVAVYLFGSRVHGRARPYSDIDLCIVVSPGIAAAEKEDILCHSSPVFDISIFSDLSLPIRRRVVGEGVLLFCRDDLFIHRITVRTIRDYQDALPRIERSTARILGDRRV